MPSGIFVNAGHLFGIAKDAYERAKSEEGDRSGKSSDALVAIVFSAVAAEAFINELAELASQAPEHVWPEAGSEPHEVSDLARLVSEANGLHGSVKLKFHLAKIALSGSSFDEGGVPYQDFALLMELRNTLAHLKFDKIRSVRINEVDVEPPAIIKKLRSKNILAQFDDEENVIASWLYWVSTRAAAKWACNATSGIVRDMCAAIPDGELRRMTELFYSHSGVFEPIT